MEKALADGTIVAIATPLGEGGLGVVRLSGPDAFQIADRLFRAPNKLSDAPSHTIQHGWISNAANEKIDEVLASVFRKPRSYSGEDTVEFSCHGSPQVLKDVVALCVAAGARYANPGEFTQRAYLNGRLDLAQAEAVAALIHATSSTARQLAVGQLRGVLSQEIEGLRQAVMDLLAHLEANLDFAEEALPVVERTEIQSRLEKITAQLKSLLDTSVRGRLFREGIRVPLVGRPNVGKSSLFNRLLAQDRAIVTDVPGTTRDTLEEKVQWQGLSIALTDTAGLRETGDPVEKEGTKRSRRALEEADVVLFVVDGSMELTPADRAIATQLRGKKVIGVLNKFDIGLKLDAGDLLKEFGWMAAVPASAVSGTGLPEVRGSVLSTMVGDVPETEAGAVVTHGRHVAHLENALAHLQACAGALHQAATEETLSLELRAALLELGRITGQDVTEDLLSSIFRQFCIGK